MSCIGKDCAIRKQEARNPLLTQVDIGNQCTPEQVGALEAQAKQKILDDATKTEHDCETGCNCEAKRGAVIEETDWGPVPVEPFELRAGACVFKVLAATVETRVTKTPGLCKRGRIAVSSAAFIGDGIEVLALKADVLTDKNIEQVRKAFGLKS